jgi:hypothetical protein
MTDGKVQAARKLIASGTPPLEVAHSLGVSSTHKDQTQDRLASPLYKRFTASGANPNADCRLLADYARTHTNTQDNETKVTNRRQAWRQAFSGDSLLEF